MLSSGKSATSLLLDLTCFVCNIIIPGDIKRLFSHFRDIHCMQTSNATRVDLICGQNGCKESFTSISGFRSHLKICSLAQTQCNRHLSNDESISEDSFDAYDTVPEPNSIPQPFPVCQPPPGPEPCPLTISVGKIMLELRAKHNVSHAALNCLARGLHNAFLDLSQGDPPENLSSPESVFANFDSQFKRSTYFKNYLGYKPPKEKVVGRRQVNQLQNGRITTKFISNTFQYISLRETLTTLFSNPTFFKLYFSEKPSSDGFMRSHRDGKHYKTHPLFSVDPFALRLQIFFYDVEITNPLGSKTKIHELAMFCFSILNLPPSLNSLLSNIHAFAVSVSKHIKQNGFDFVLKELMTEISILESDGGMILNLPHRPKFCLRGTIVSFCADTKGAHELMGFMSPSADKLCRVCLISRGELKLHSTTKNVQLRTEENYKKGIENLTGVKGDSSTGLKSNCSVNASRFFHVVTNPVLDSMHDFLEGIVPFILKLVLREILLKHKDFGISANLLNDRIKKFSYGTNDLSNKPSPRFTNEGLLKPGNYNTKQRAAQNWCLIRMFPLMFGDLIPIENPYFALILLLLDIMDIVFSPVLATGHTIMLEELIDRFYFQFNILFPNVSPINKFHHMIHYPQIITMHGPPIRFWCMRYEAFHNLVKRKAQTNCNFRNVAKSLANHLQSVNCCNMQSPDSFQDQRIAFGPFLSTMCYSDATERYPLCSILDTSHGVSTTSWVIVNGWNYNLKSVIVLKRSNETESGYPEFGRVKVILIQENKIFFIISQYVSIFDEHFHAFQLHESRVEIDKLVCLKSLPDCEPLSFLKPFKTNHFLYVAPRHII